MAELVHATCAGRVPAVLRKCWVSFGKTEVVAGVRPLPPQELQGLAALPVLQVMHLAAATCERSKPQEVLSEAAPYLGTVPLKLLKLWMFAITPDIYMGRYRNVLTADTT